MALNALSFNFSRPFLPGHPFRRTAGVPFICSHGLQNEGKDGILGATSLKICDLGKQKLLPCSSVISQSYNMKPEFQINMDELVHENEVVPR